jgi:hypothetical protein
MCVNLTGSEVNSNLEFIKFLYPSFDMFDDCADLVYPGCCMGKVDRTDGGGIAQVSIGIKPPDSGELMRYTAFPFGLSVSPHYFCAAISEVHRLLRQHHRPPFLRRARSSQADTAPSHASWLAHLRGGYAPTSVVLWLRHRRVALTNERWEPPLGSRVFMRLGLGLRQRKALQAPSRLPPLPPFLTARTPPS